MPDDSNSDAPLDFTAILKEPAPESSAGRLLTSGEIADARAVFGDAIDYAQVRIYDGDYWGYGNDVLTTFDGEIYIPEAEYRGDFSNGSIEERGAFLHEMTHVWQDQNFVGYDGVDINKALTENGGNYDKLYDYNLEPDKDFFEYNNEQQGVIVDDYFRAANNKPWPGTESIGIDDYKNLLPFDLYGGERLEPTAPANDDRAPADIGSQPENGSGLSGQQIASAPQSPASPATPNAGPGDDGPVSEEDGLPATPPQPTTSSSPPPSQPVSTARPLTPEDIENDAELAEDQRWLEENGNVPGEDDQGTGGAGNEDDDDDEQGTGGASSEMPNPVDDGPSLGSGDFSVLVNRNAPYVNPGSGDFDMPDAGGNIFDLLNRNAPAVNPGSGDFDMPAVSGNVSMLLNRNAPTVNPGLVDFDMPVGGDLSDLLDRNGPRQAAAPDDADLAGSSVNGDLLSGFDFAGGLDDFAGFDIV